MVLEIQGVAEHEQEGPDEDGRGHADRGEERQRLPSRPAGRHVDVRPRLPAATEREAHLRAEGREPGQAKACGLLSVPERALVRWVDHGDDALVVPGGHQDHVVLHAERFGEEPRGELVDQDRVSRRRERLLGGAERLAVHRIRGELDDGRRGRARQRLGDGALGDLGHAEQQLPERLALLHLRERRLEGFRRDRIAAGQPRSGLRPRGLKAAQGATHGQRARERADLATCRVVPVAPLVPVARLASDHEARSGER